MSKGPIERTVFDHILADLRIIGDCLERPQEEREIHVLTTMLRGTTRRLAKALADKREMAQLSETCWRRRYHRRKNAKALQVR